MKPARFSWYRAPPALRFPLLFTPTAGMVPIEFGCLRASHRAPLKPRVRRWPKPMQKGSRTAEARERKYLMRL